MRFTGLAHSTVLFSEAAENEGINLKVVREPDYGYWSNVWLQKPFCCSYWGGRPTPLMFSADYAWTCRGLVPLL